jgi:hypothetical protein
MFITYFIDSHYHVHQKGEEVAGGYDEGLFGDGW